MSSESVNVRMDSRLIEYIDGFISPNGPYESRSEYLRDIVRRDMERRISFPQEDLTSKEIGQSILAGYRDLAEGRIMEMSGDIFKDLERFREKEKNGWK